MKHVGKNITTGITAVVGILMLTQGRALSQEEDFPRYLEMIPPPPPREVVERRNQEFLDMFQRLSMKEKRALVADFKQKRKQFEVLSDDEKREFIRRQIDSGAEPPPPPSLMKQVMRMMQDLERKE